MALPQSSTAPTSGARSGYAKSVDTRARILAAAVEEATESGIQKTSLAAVATRAKVAIGSVNYHFGSREELLRALMSSVTETLLARFHAAHPDDNKTFFEQQRADLRVYLDYMRSHPSVWRLAGEIRLHEPALFERAVHDWHQRIIDRIRRGIARGELRRMNDPEIAAQAYFMVGAHQLLEYRPKGKADQPFPDDGAIAESYIRLLRGGLASPRKASSGEGGRPPRGRIQSSKPRSVP